ncbi:hypothetical protein [Brevibacillus agri]|uniref:hypothetical protein n=1 Tax=Brevibacillus agri TaxID=51101 RepID=UPI003D20EEF9
MTSLDAKNAHYWITVIFAGLVFLLVLNYIPAQDTVQEQIFAERGYKIVSQSESIATEFIFDPTWVPQAGESKTIDFIFYDANNTQIYVSEVKNNGQMTYVNLKFSSNYNKEGGNFVTSTVIHKDNGQLNYSGVLIKPRFYDVQNNEELAMEYSTGIGPDDLITLGFGKKEMEQFSGKKIAVKLSNLNLVQYRKI